MSFVLFGSLYSFKRILFLYILRLLLQYLCITVISSYVLSVISAWFLIPDNFWWSVTTVSFFYCDCDKESSELNLIEQHYLSVSLNVHYLFVVICLIQFENKWNSISLNKIVLKVKCTITREKKKDSDWPF